MLDVQCVICAHLRLKLLEAAQLCDGTSDPNVEIQRVAIEIADHVVEIVAAERCKEILKRGNAFTMSNHWVVPTRV